MVEEDTVYHIDIDEACAGYTVWLHVNGEQADWWPVVGHFYRAEALAERL